MNIEVDTLTFYELRSGVGLDRVDSRSVVVRDSDTEESFAVGELTIKRQYEPHNLDAEAGLLGALMIDNRLLDHVTGLQSAHFASPLHARIFEAIRDRIARNQLANPVTLKPVFENDEELAEVGGPSYLAELTGSGAAVIGARDFAAQITDLFVLRKIREKMREGMERAKGAEDVAPGEIVADLETQLTEALIDPPIKTTVTFADALKDSVREIEETSQGKEPAGFKISRYTDWNAVCGRMEPGDFILLGGRPSMGKTAVAAAVSLGAAEAGIGTDFLSLEMDRRKAMRRIIAELIYDPDCPLRYQDLIDGKLTREHWRKIANATSDLAALPLTISDPPVMAVEDVAPHIRRRKREFEKRGTELKLVVLDYLGRLETRRKLQGTTEIVSHISRALKAAAKETDTAVVALAQLSRGLEGRENKRPQLSDLRDSGSLEQDADTVVFVYREEYYLERAEPRREAAEKWQKWADEIAGVRDDMELFSAKRREGALAKRVSKFLTQYQSVMDHNDPRIAGNAGLFDTVEGWPEMRG